MSRTSRIAAVSLLALALLTCAPAPASAQGESDTQSEVWPEVQLFYRLDPKTRLFVLGTFTRVRDASYSEGQAGIHLDYALNQYVSVRAGYRFSHSVDDDDPFRENRLLLEQTLRVPLGTRWRLYDRNRGDLRFLRDGFSARYRNRLTLERDVTVRERVVTFYGSAEAYYDTRHEVWNRTRFAAGAVIPFGKHVSLETYVARQSDTRSSPRFVNALGTALIFQFP